MEAVITISRLFKSFDRHRVLEDFNLNLYRGENLMVLGKSGCGKSVLIKCIIGLLRPERGSIHVLGQNVLRLKQMEMDQIRAKVGFLFQSNALYDSMTVRENLEFPLRRHTRDMTKEAVDELVKEALSNVGLEHTEEMMPSELSGGMRKRIALARTLILKPEIILYDEPTTGLDPITSLEIINLMMAIREKYHTSSIIISHDLKCAKMASDRIAMMIDRTCYAQGTYEELSNASDEKIKQFFL